MKLVVVALLAALSLAGDARAGDDAGWLFDPDAVVEVDLGIPAASREALAADPASTWTRRSR